MIPHGCGYCSTERALERIGERDWGASGDQANPFAGDRVREAVAERVESARLALKILYI
jgi:hypothetical protein